MANPEITQNDNTPLLIGDQLLEDQTILAAENPAAGQVLGVITASGKLAKCDSTAVDGSEIPKYLITEAVTNAADVVKSVVKTGIYDENKLVFEGTDTLATVVSGKTMKDWLHERGLYGKDSQHLDFPDNA